MSCIKRNLSSVGVGRGQSKTTRHFLYLSKHCLPSEDSARFLPALASPYTCAYTIGSGPLSDM